MVVTRRLIVIVIFSAVLIGLLLQGMLWRVEEVGIDRMVALSGLAAAGILVMVGLMYYHELCNSRKCE